jgi:hypothetical protein
MAVSRNKVNIKGGEDFWILKTSQNKCYDGPKSYSTTGKVKIKLSLCFNSAPRHEGVSGSGGIAPLIL